MKRQAETYTNTRYWNGRLVTEKVTSRIIKELPVEPLKGNAIVTHVSYEGFRFSILGSDYIRRFDGPSEICTSLDEKRAFDFRNVSFDMDIKILPSLYTKMMNETHSKAFWLKLN